MDKNLIFNNLKTHPTNKEEALNWDYKFWKTMPVPNINEIIPTSNIINNDIIEKFSSNNEVKLSEFYEWCTLEKNDINLVTEFFNKYYISNINKKFSLLFNDDYFNWLLSQAPSTILVLRVKNNKKLAGILFSSTKNYQIFNKETLLADVNYLVIHPKLRNKNITPLFIKEFVRRMTNQEIKAGFFATEKYIPTPFCKIEHYYRPLNYRKLYQSGFIKLDDNVTLKEGLTAFSVKYVPDNYVVKMTEKHYEDAFEILNSYQDKYNFYQKYTLEQFIKTFSNDSNSISSYVILDKDNLVVDFYSYYKLSYHIPPKDSNPATEVKAAFMHTYTSNITLPLFIFKSAIMNAYNEGLDIFYCNDTMENNNVLFDNYSKIVKGSGYSYCNFFNWKCPSITPQQMYKTIL